MLRRGDDPAVDRLPGPAPGQGPGRESGVRPLRVLGRLGVVALLLAGGLGLTLSGEGQGPPRVIARLGASTPTRAAADPSPAPDPAGPATALGHALSSGDPAGLGGIVDPAAPAVLARWQAVVRSVGVLGLTEVSFTVGTGTPADPARAAAWDRLVSLPVSVHYRLPGWDPVPARTDLTLTEGLRAGHWMITADPPTGAPAASSTVSPAAAQERVAALDPWLLGAVEVARTAHVLVVGDPGRSADLRALAARLEAAATLVRRIVPAGRWNGKVVAYASRSPAFVAGWFGASAATAATPGGREPATFAAEVRSEGGTSRLALTPFLISRDDARSRAVLRHEVTHVALAGPGGPEVATWLAEGTAEFVGYGAAVSGRVDAVAALGRRGLPEATWRALRSPTWQPVLADRADRFYSGSTASVGDRYTAAWLVCLYIAAHYGQGTLFAVYAAATPTADQDPAALAVTALRQVLHVDPSTLSRNAGAFARGLRRSFA